MRFWLAFMVLLPVVAAQGLWVKRRAIRLPARLDNGDVGETGDGPAMKLVVVGESPVVGVGCDDASQSMSCQLARCLAERGGLRVRWQVIGANGARAEDIANMLERRTAVGEPVGEQIAVVALGVNDVTGLRSRRHWHDQLALIRQRLITRGCQRVFLAPVPPIWQFTLLPQPLRWLFGVRARALEAERWLVAARFADVTALDTTFPDRRELLASDGFHPGPEACALWAGQLSEQIIAVLERGRNGPA